MRRWRALLPGLLALLPLACVGGHQGRSAAPAATYPFQAPEGDVVQLDVALLERPAGDPYLREGLWAYTDEQAVELDQRALLEENGLRVGLIVGLPPTELGALLASPRACSSPRRRLIVPGSPVALALGPTRPEFRYHVRKEGKPAEVVLQQAQCSLVVVATLTADGQTRLHFTPRLEHGPLVPHYAAVPDASGWVMEIQRQNVTYDELSWDVSVPPNKYLVLGAGPDSSGTLGQEAFVDPQGPTPVQRLLVLRTCRSGGGIDAEIAEPKAGPGQSPHTPALALQAAWSAARANRE